MASTGQPLIVGICGSLREDSKTRIAVELALSAAAERGATTELVDLREYDLPPLKSTAEPVPDADRLRSTVERADAILLGTPNYHGSYSGVLKNALDYCGRDEFEGKTVGLLEVAGGSYPGPALIHLRQVCRTLNAWTLPTEVGVPRSHATVDTDGISDGDVADRVKRLGRELAANATTPEACAGATAD